MDTVVPMTATQLALIWPLIGFLLIWMILFGVLAFRRDPAKRNTSTGITLTPGKAHTPSTPAMLQVLVAQPATTGTIMPVNSASMVSTSGSDFSNGKGVSTPML